MAGRVIRSAAARARTAAKTETGRRTTRSAAYGNEEEENETLEDVTFPPGVEPAFVRASAGGTYNLGDYQSLRLDVSVTLPCRPSRIEETYERAASFVAEKLNKEEVSWLGSKGR